MSIDKKGKWETGQANWRGGYRVKYYDGGITKEYDFMNNEKEMTNICEMWPDH